MARKVDAMLPDAPPAVGRHVEEREADDECSGKGEQTPSRRSSSPPAGAGIYMSTAAAAGCPKKSDGGDHV